MKAAIRIQSLTLGGSGPASLPAMERHGKRLDGTSAARRARDADPLVYGSFDLRAAFDDHVAGARMNAGLKRPVLHAIIQWPREIPITPKNEQLMLARAVDFVDRTHGGRAVFAARLDRDEAGRHTVDVFFAPRYEKRTKAGVEEWISTSKHGKQLAQKHREKILARDPGAPRIGTPRHVGIAMQEELAEYMAELGLQLAPRREKKAGRSDRLDPEAYKARRDAEDLLAAAEAQKKAQDRREKDLNSREIHLDFLREGVEKARQRAENMMAEAGKELDLAQKIKDEAERMLRWMRDQYAPVSARFDALFSRRSSGPADRHQEPEPPAPGPGF